MKLKDLVGLLETHHKWSCKKSEGDYICRMNLGEVQIQLIPNVGKRSDHFRVGLGPSVSLKEFSEACKFIRGRRSDFNPICVNWALGEKIVDLSPEEVTRLSENAISWALSQDLEEGLTQYRNLPTNSKGSMPVRHLAALAIAGDVERLNYYKQCFDTGNRLGFALYISVEMIERAISIAHKVKEKR